MDDVTKTAPKAARKAANPVVTEIVRNGLVAVTEEMKINLMRTAYNMIIYEALDFTVGLFDARGNIVSIGLGLPMFIRGMSETVKAKIEHYGVENIEPGDVLLTNDAYITGSHLNHMTFTVPVFHDDELVGFSCCMAHWPDVGGTIMEGTTDIFSEGLQMPIVKIYRKGEPNEELIDLIKMNVRLPERAMGDFRAQLAAVKTGERRFAEMVRKYGRDDVLNGIDAIMDQSEAVARARVKNMPDGVYEAESFMDDDGINVGQRVPIKVRVEIAGDKMTVDLTGVSPQVQGFYNSGKTAGLSCAQVAFKCLTSSLDLPINEGQFRALDIVLPPGRVVSATKPAAMRMWMTYPMTIVDTIFKALAPALPDRVIAGHHADLCVGRINGRRPKDDSFYIYLGGLIGGGWGAKYNSDGRNAVIAMNDGDTHNGPSEQVEAKYPLLVERYSLRPDSGGAGKYRGGLGAEQVVQARHPIRFSSLMERARCKPWGLYGGLSGHGNAVAVHRFNQTDETRFPSAKALNQVLQPGDAYIIRSGGGGGYGSPLERDLETLERDVRCGYVTKEAAEKYYGAVFKGDTLALDIAGRPRPTAPTCSGRACRTTSRSPRSSSRSRPRRRRRRACPSTRR